MIECWSGNRDSEYSSEMLIEIFPWLWDKREKLMLLLPDRNRLDELGDRLIENDSYMGEVKNRLRVFSMALYTMSKYFV